MDIEKLMLPKKTVAALKKKKIFTDRDLIEFKPIHYKDYTKIVTLPETKDGTSYAVRATIKKVEQKHAAKPFLSVACLTPDGTWLRVTYFSGTWMAPRINALKQQDCIIMGRFRNDPDYGWQCTEPDGILPERLFEPHIKPVYSQVPGVSDEMLAKIIEHCIPMQPETIEPEILDKAGMVTRSEALYGLHFPKTKDELSRAFSRMRFDDLMYFASILRSTQVQGAVKGKRMAKTSLCRQFVNGLPYDLTDDQASVVNHILTKAAAGERNNILIQGDVGCGKTVVAAAAVVLAHENGYQSVLMAPRDILAEQHYKTLSALLEPAGIKCALLHSGMKAKERKDALKSIKEGSSAVVIGTTSCLNDEVSWKNLGLTITDEEHLFGVAQKEKLEEKAMDGVHAISMSATPIPRSLAGVLYGEDKDIEIIRTMPSGRKPVQTAIISTHKAVFRFMEKEINKGNRCYVVCPAIESDQKGELTSLNEMEELYRGYFEPKGIVCASVNGKMNKAEVKDIMDSFVKGEVQVLLSTTVIEVGINVPEATVMVIEQADRFGLATLHQLRGRVGRSSMQSYCVLISEDKDNPRLKTMCETTDGFRIAEADLKLRGAGTLLGSEQSGFNKYLDQMLTFPDLFKECRKLADEYVPKGYCQWLMATYNEMAPA